MTIKRTFADFLEKRFDVRILRPHRLPLLFEQEHLKKFFREFKIDCVFDVGANVGQYADMIRERCEFEGPIISFEPIPKHARTLSERAKSHDNWIVEQTVLSSEDGPVKFHVTVGDQLSSLNAPDADDLYPVDAAVAQTLELQATTLKDHFDKYQRTVGFKRAFLKLDTQGSDLRVAIGAGDRLQQFVGLQSELSFKPLYENIPSAEDALAYYRSKGFELSAFVPNNLGHFPVLVESDCILFNRKHWLPAAAN